MKPTREQLLYELEKANHSIVVLYQHIRQLEELTMTGPSSPDDIERIQSESLRKQISYNMPPADHELIKFLAVRAGVKLIPVVPRAECESEDE